MPELNPQKMKQVGQSIVNVQSELTSVDGVLVHCMMPNGEEVCVPLKVLLSLYRNSIGSEQDLKDALQGRR